MQMRHAGKKKGKNRKWWILAGVISLLLLGGGFMLRQIRANAQEQLLGQTGDTVTVFVGDLEASATASGQIKPQKTTRLSANSPGIVAEVLVQVGSEVEAGDLLVQLQTDSLLLQVERAQLNVALKEIALEALQNGSRPEDIQSAEAGVNSARINLVNLLAGPTAAEIAEAEANLRAQQASVQSASISYQGTVAVNESSVTSARIELLNAQLAYDNAQRVNENNPNVQTHEAMLNAAERVQIAQLAYDKANQGASSGNVSNAAAGISSAVANRDRVEINNQQLLAGGSAEQIAAAEASLAQAEANLDRLVHATSAEQLLIAEANLEKAEISLAGAEENLDKASIRAPFAGRVTAVSVAPGEFASGTIVEMVSNEFHLILNVDEIDVGVLSIGQKGVVTLESWPDQPIQAELVAIAPSANSSSGVVVYDVQLNLEAVELPILVGMTANARLVTSEYKDILLVSNAAITADREAGIYKVNVVTGEGENGLPQIESREVQIGLRDNQFTQILSGLSEGEELIIGELVIPTLQFGPGNGPRN